MTPSRAQLAAAAQGMADGLCMTNSRTGEEIPLRVVVIITTLDGEFVGVGANTSNEDRDHIITCAAEKADRQVHIEIDAPAVEGGT